MFNYCLIFVLSALAVTPECAKILGVFPTASISHQVVFRELTLELVKIGHEMTVITTDPAFKDINRPKNLIEIDMRNVSYGKMRQFMYGKFNTDCNGNADSVYKTLIPLLDTMTSITEDQMNTKEVQTLLKSDQTFDLVIAEAVMPVGLGFAYRYKIPVIEISSFYASDLNYMFMGAASHPFLYPPPTRVEITNLTITDKLLNLAKAYSVVKGYMGITKRFDNLLQKHFGDDTPGILDLEKKVDLIFVNSYPIWEFNRPVAMNVVFLGALHVKEPKELPKDLGTLLDSSKHGFIYVSFGSNVDPANLPDDKKKLFLNVFSKLPYDIIWKWNEGDIPGKPKNVYTFKWLPQNDLLYHPKIKMFITQGGMQSTDETIAAAVPVLGIPMLGDQFFNTAKYEYFKIGERIWMDALTEVELLKSINSVIDNKSYKENIMKLRDIMRDMPQTSMERAVWWTEYVIRHKGARHLRPPSADVSMSEFLELKLIAAILGILTTLLSAVILVLYVAVKIVLRIFKEKEVKIKKN